MESTAVSVTTVPRATTTPSNLHRRLLCPGSGRMEAGAADRDSIDAARGRLFHRYWGNSALDRSFLSIDEQDLLALSDRLLDDVLARLAFETIHEPITRAGANQKRHDDSHLQPVCHVEQTVDDGTGFSGTPDRVYIWQHRESALVADLKSGFAIVERAELNLQLRGYAVLLADRFIKQLNHVYVSIIQPRLWSPSERITLAHYERADLAKARAEVYGIIEKSQQPDAPLRAGEEQCRFCKAKLTCPAFREAMALPIAAFESEEKLSKTKREAVIEQRLKECSDEQLERVIKACQLAGFVEDAARDEARERIKAGAFTNYTLGNEWDMRSIVDARKAIAMLDLTGVATREEILKISEIPLKKLETIYRERTNTTWREARTKIDKVLASVIERVPCKPKILPKK